MNKQAFIEAVKFDEKGLVAAIAQDVHAKKVRMLAYMNKEALEKTLETGKVHYYSRSRQSLWLKGETSGHFQYLKGISIDCDGDALLLQIEQVGGVSCHTGNATCFYRELKENVVVEKTEIDTETKGQADAMLQQLYAVIKQRKIAPKEGSYTNYLFQKGENKILKKVGEEATEVIIAAKENNKEEITFEVADLLYHLSVLLVEKEMTWEMIGEELGKRA